MRTVVFGAAAAMALMAAAASGLRGKRYVHAESGTEPDTQITAIPESLAADAAR